MSDLHNLIEAVERGDRAVTNWRDFAALIHDGDTMSDLPILAHRAYHGDLNAAAALHEALLPGWGWEMYHQDGCRVWESGNPTNLFIGKATDPARAWLLAILRAVEAKGGVA